MVWCQFPYYYWKLNYTVINSAHLMVASCMNRSGLSVQCMLNVICLAVAGWWHYHMEDPWMLHNRQKSEAERNSHHPHTSKFMITFQCLIIAARYTNAELAVMFYCCRLLIIFSLANLHGLSADLHRILPQVGGARIWKCTTEIWGPKTAKFGH